MINQFQTPVMGREPDPFRSSPVLGSSQTGGIGFSAAGVLPDPGLWERGCCGVFEI